MVNTNYAIPRKYYPALKQYFQFVTHKTLSNLIKEITLDISHHLHPLKRQKLRSTLKFGTIFSTNFYSLKLEASHGRFIKENSNGQSNNFEEFG